MCSFKTLSAGISFTNDGTYSVPFIGPPPAPKLPPCDLKRYSLLRTILDEVMFTYSRLAPRSWANEARIIKLRFV